RPFRTIHRHPRLARDPKEGPAMIGVQRFGLMSLIREIKTDLEATGDAFRPAERIEERMKIRAIALPNLAGVPGAAPPPTVMIFVVTHLVEDITINGPRFSQSVALPCGRCTSQLTDLLIHNHQPIGFLVNVEFARC